MTDEQIIKALGCCGMRDCGKCPYAGFTKECSNLSILALDLINRRKAEIERLKRKNTILSKNADTAFQDGLDENRDLFKKEVEPEIRNEAIKEFAERLKQNITESVALYWDEGTGGYYLAEDVIDDIDNLVQEMMEEK